MAVFAYVARDGTGREIRGTLEAQTQELLIRRLRERGLFVNAVTRQSEAAKATGVLGRFKGVGLRDLSIFCRQFATLLDAGVSLVRALMVMEKQTANYNLKAVLRDMQAEVEGGASLSRAMSKHPRVFSRLHIGLVRAGEVGGVMEEVWERMAVFMEKDMELRRRIRSALTYPVVVMFIVFCIATGMVTFILPKFVALFKDFNVATMPALTQFWMNVCNFLTGRTGPVPNVIIIAAGVFVFITILRGILRTRVGSRAWDIVKLKLPVFGPIAQKIAIARFARTFSTLLESGVPILQAMDSVAATVGNTVVADAVMRARASIREGDEIAPPLEASGLFPPMVVHMVGVGEETGSLSLMLDKVADHYEKDVDASIESLTASLEPFLIIFMGAVVGSIVVSMYLPLIAMVQGMIATSGA